MTKARILADYVAGGTTAAEFDYMDGVTSNVQPQMNAKAPLASPTFTGTANLSSGVTMPAGHVVQTVHTKYHADSTDNQTGSTLVRCGVSSTYHWKASISGLQTNSDVLIICTFLGSIYDADTTNAQGCFGFLRDDDGSGTNLGIIMEGLTHDWYDNTAGRDSGTNDHYAQLTLTYMDTAPTQTAHTYYLGYKTDGGSAIMCRSESTNTPFTMTLQEIKR